MNIGNIGITTTINLASNLQYITTTKNKYNCNI